MALVSDEQHITIADWTQADGWMTRAERMARSASPITRSRIGCHYQPRPHRSSANHEPCPDGHHAGDRTYDSGTDRPRRRAHQQTLHRVFTANIRNPNTRLAYAHAVAQFLAWCEQRGAALRDIEPVMVAAYIEGHAGAPQTVKQHLAAIKMLFDWLVIGQVVPTNPAASVRGPRYSIKKSKTPVLSAEDARKLLDSIDVSHVIRLRDRALIGMHRRA
ncbi:MAG: phage integrase N-terminal SAM-like domain-containing protein [Pyrinomonadaceae bacterium MAG19_C2-C3]|nr:phage integrase N-terminal SAM-like domain-containing protein [Pyrinomonadaceae bacterium MAG19_C2-C3]